MTRQKEEEGRKESDCLSLVSVPIFAAIAASEQSATFVALL